MNCPNCRRKLWYESMLSVPNAKSKKDKQLVYWCAPCGTLYVMKEFDAKTAVRGVLVMTRGNLKRAGFREIKESTRSSRGGES